MALPRSTSALPTAPRGAPGTSRVAYRRLARMRGEVPRRGGNLADLRRLMVSHSADPLAGALAAVAEAKRLQTRRHEDIIAAALHP